MWLLRSKDGLDDDPFIPQSPQTPIIHTQGAEAFTDLDSLQTGSAIKFDGEFRESGPLEAFLEKHRAPKPKQAAAAADGKKKAEAEAGAEKGKEGKGGKAGGEKGQKPPAFRVLDAGSFKGEVYKDADNAWLVWFKPSAGPCIDRDG